MTRMPIRLRVTLAFTAAMTLVLASFGAFIFINSANQLDEAIDDNLEVRTADLASVAASDGRGNVTSLQELDPEDSFAQIVGGDGSVTYSTSQTSDSSVLSRSELAAARSVQSTFEREELEGLDGSIRILATPIEGTDSASVAVVGATLEDRDESLRNLALLLGVGGPVALLLAGLAGYLVAGRALAPVERMRGDAASITASAAGDRLAIPAADDELRRLATTLNEMLGRLEAGIERERRFVDDASHELRTPLALHKTELELAQRYAKDETELRAAIASGIVEVDRLAQLADDLLVVARSGEGGLDLDVTDLKAADLLATIATRFAARAESAHRSVEVASGTGVHLRGDRLRLEQALTNMVENALRHGAGRVVLTAEKRSGATRLHVGDEGIGFPADFRGQAFERFSRGDAARGRGGAGLGLAIVDAIATAHGGSAGIGEPEQGGADVWIELP